MIEHDLLYYDRATPKISDYEYDQLLKQLQAYEKEHPGEMHPKSPTQRIGEGPTKGFQQREHMIPMMSLANTYSEEEVGDFVKRVHKLLEMEKVAFCCELKLDGAAISLRYRKGKLFSALTRGNGHLGDDVTANIKTIPAVPLELEGEGFPEDFEVRGEVHLSTASFHAINRQREVDGLELFANPRNAAAGSLKLLDPAEVAKRKLHVVCYGIAEGQSPAKSQCKMHHLLKKWGLPIVDHEYIQLAEDVQEIMSYVKKVHHDRPSLPFEIDGVVVKVDDLSLHDILGSTGKVPRYAMAYKFAPEQAETQITDIAVQVGRSGVLTPVAELVPVFLAGSTISRATLHNQEEVARKDIRVGDTVIIEKGGDVIPKVVRVERHLAQSKPWHMPKHCPVCKAEVVHKEGEVAVRCPNTDCMGQRTRKIAYFASKYTMDIEHMGEKVVDQLVEKGLVSRVSDIYLLTAEDLALLEGFKEKSIHNLLKSIDASRKIPLSRFVMALGIPSVGTETAELLAEEAGDLDTLCSMTEEEFNAIAGIGDKTAKAIYAFFQDKDQREEIRLLLKHGVHPEKMKKKIQGHPFFNKVFVLTGALQHYTRDEVAALIKERGGKVSGSVSKNTDYVLVGDEPGSKYEKAKKLGINILSEDQFEKMCHE